MIKQIKFKIGEKEIELTEGEAMQLYAELDRIFCQKAEPYPVYPAYPWIVPSVWEPYTVPPSVTWGSDTYTTNSEIWAEDKGV